MPASPASISRARPIPRRWSTIRSCRRGAARSIRCRFRGSTPTATHLGWNLRKAGYAEGEICSLTGSTIPLARTKEERLAAGDRRPSLAERYPDHAAYVSAVAAAAKKLEADRLMLAADRERIVKEAEASDIGR